MWTTNGAKWAKGAKAEPTLFALFAIFVGFAIQDFAHRPWLSQDRRQEAVNGFGERIERIRRSA
jgi:hypothetical protein